jgi:hypothetical protein
VTFSELHIHCRTSAFDGHAIVFGLGSAKRTEEGGGRGISEIAHPYHRHLLGSAR